MGRHESDDRCGQAITGGGRAWARSATLVMAGVVAGALVAGGVAVATIPSSTGGTVSACVKTIGGAVRVIDFQAGKRCTTSEKLVQWSRLVSRGAYSSTASYKAGDIVQSGGSTYLAKVASKGKPVSSATSWTLLAAKGATGAQGPQGPQGLPGAAGAPGPAGVGPLFGSSVLANPSILTNVPGIPTVAIQVTLPKGVYLVTGTLSGLAAASTVVSCSITTSGQHDAIQGSNAVEAIGGRTTSVSIVGHVSLLDTATVRVDCRSDASNWNMTLGNLEALTASSLSD